MNKKEFNKIIKTLEKAVKNFDKKLKKFYKHNDYNDKLDHIGDNIEMAIGNLCEIYDDYFIAIKKLDR